MQNNANSSGQDVLLFQRLIASSNSTVNTVMTQLYRQGDLGLRLEHSDSRVRLRQEIRVRLERRLLQVCFFPQIRRQIRIGLADRVEGGLGYNEIK